MYPLDAVGYESFKMKNIYKLAIFPWAELPTNFKGFNMGCGTGRWARLVAPIVGKLHCIDPSNAIHTARANLSEHLIVSFYDASVDSQCLPSGSQDFGYSLGILHNISDALAAIRSCVDWLKPSAPLLLCPYYAFENRPWWFRAVWRVSDLVRQNYLPTATIPQTHGC
jgi:ubiquinone/menaquinone biosynthesis C-methylase UbiE